MRSTAWLDMTQLYCISCFEMGGLCKISSVVVTLQVSALTVSSIALASLEYHPWLTKRYYPQALLVENQKIAR